MKKLIKSYIADRSVNRICFVHVPKCGGTSVVSAIDQSYSYLERLIYTKHGLELSAAQKAAHTLNEMEQLVRSSVCSYQLGLPLNRFVHGHFFCPPDIVNQFSSKWKFVTILRNPIERFVSEFIYNSFKKENWKKNILSIEDYLNSKTAVRAGRVYLDSFSTSGIRKVNLAQNVKLDVEIAIDNLRNFHLVGTLEDLNVWEQGFRRIVGKEVNVLSRNKSPRLVEKSKILQKELYLSRIQELCKFDLEIYDALKNE